MSVWIALQPRGLIGGGGNEGDLAPNFLINENKCGFSIHTIKVLGQLFKTVS